MAIFLEYADSDGVDEVGEVHAAYIALGLDESSSRWTCIPVQNQFEVDGLATGVWGQMVF